MNQSKQQTLSFINCRCRRGLGRTVDKKFSIGRLCVFAGGFAFVRNGLAFQKLAKTPLIYSVSCFNLGGAWSFVCGTKPTKAPP